MATRKISSTAATVLRSAAYTSPRSPATTGLLPSLIGSTNSRFLYSTAVEKSSPPPPPPQDVTFWKQLFRKGLKAMTDAAVQPTRRCQDVIVRGKCEALDNYGIDLTEFAWRGKLNPVLGHEDEIGRCMQILSRETKNNPLIIGDKGKERTRIVEGLAQHMVYGDALETLVNRKLISLDTGSLLADTKSREHFEQKLEAVLKEIAASNDQYIIFIDDIHTIVGAGLTHDKAIVGNLLNSMLGQGDLQIVGATNWCGLAQHMVYGDVLETLVNRKLISLDTGSLLADTKSREHFEQKLEAVLKEIAASNDQYIIFIDDIHTIVGAGLTHGKANVGNLLNSMLSQGDLQIVGATNWRGYGMYIHNLYLNCRFQKVVTEGEQWCFNFKGLAEDILF